MKVQSIELLAADAGWRNYHFVKLTTDTGTVGWSEYDEGFGAPGVSAVIERMTPRVIGQQVNDHERIYAELYCATRPGSGSVVSLGIAAIENALLDAKAKALGVPVYELLGGKIRDRVDCLVGEVERDLLGAHQRAVLTDQAVLRLDQDALEVIARKRLELDPDGQSALQLW